MKSEASKSTISLKNGYSYWLWSTHWPNHISHVGKTLFILRGLSRHTIEIIGIRTVTREASGSRGELTTIAPLKEHSIRLTPNEWMNHHFINLLVHLSISSEKLLFLVGGD